MRSSVAVAAILLTLSVGFSHPAWASNPPGVPDAFTLVQMEDRAEHASPREQCFLFTELVHDYTEIAGKQMADGEMEQASATLHHIQVFAQRIHMGLARDTKRIKNAEMLMQTTVFHLGQYMHLVSNDDKEVVASTLKQLDRVNDELLAQVFSR